MGAPYVEDGGVAVCEGRITSVGPFAEVRSGHRGAVCDLGEVVLLPGLINAHCHLDYTGLRGQIPPPQEGFAAWVGQINALKARLTEADYLRAIRDGFAELLRGGVTTVFNLEAFPHLLGCLPRPPLRTWWFHELIDVRDPAAAEAQVAAALEAHRAHATGWPGGAGLCPHAPYTASAGLYRACARARVPLSTHLAESADEAAMFAHARGPLYEVLARLGRPMGDCGHHSAFGHAVRAGLVGPGWLLAHANELEEEDFEWIATHPGPWRVVHCPRSHAFFGHRPFAWERLRALGVEISLGTDSLASNADLSLLAELRAAGRANPALSSEALLDMATLHPARAIGQAGQLGCLAPGAWADLIALPYAGAPGGAADAVVGHAGPVEWVRVAGEVPIC